MKISLVLLFGFAYYCDAVYFNDYNGGMYQDPYTWYQNPWLKMNGDTGVFGGGSAYSRRSGLSGYQNPWLKMNGDTGVFGGGSAYSRRSGLSGYESPFMKFSGDTGVFGGGSAYSRSANKLG